MSDAERRLPRRYRDTDASFCAHTHRVYLTRHIIVELAEYQCHPPTSGMHTYSHHEAVLYHAHIENISH